MHDSCALHWTLQGTAMPSPVSLYLACYIPWFTLHVSPYRSNSPLMKRSWCHASANHQELHNKRISIASGFRLFKPFWRHQFSSDRAGIGMEAILNYKIVYVTSVYKRSSSRQLFLGNQTNQSIVYYISGWVWLTKTQSNLQASVKISRYSYTAA